MISASLEYIYDLDTTIVASDFSTYENFTKLKY